MLKLRKFVFKECGDLFDKRREDHYIMIMRALNYYTKHTGSNTDEEFYIIHEMFIAEISMDDRY